MANTTKAPKAANAADGNAADGNTATAASAPQPAGKPQPAKTGTTASAGILRITYVKSVIGYSQKQRDTIQSLGLHRLHQSVEHRGTPEIRGMINKVSHLVRVEEVAG